MSSTSTVMFAITGFLFHYGDVKCGDPSSYPVMTPGNEKQYLCMVSFQGPGHSLPDLSCAGSETYYNEGFVKSGEATNKIFSFPSAIVKPGCNFAMFDECNYLGQRKEFKGPAVLPEVPGLIPNESRNVPDGFRSYLCECEMSYIDCSPEDKFETILYCDATNASADANCLFSKSVGTSFSTKLEHSSSIDGTIEGSIKATLFSMFEATLGLSKTTGFNWGDASQDTKSQTFTIEVSAIVPPGSKLKIEQAVGVCGETTIRTPMFKISHSGGNKRVIHLQEPDQAINIDEMQNQQFPKNNIWGKSRRPQSSYFESYLNQK